MEKRHPPFLNSIYKGQGSHNLDFQTASFSDSTWKEKVSNKENVPQGETGQVLPLKARPIPKAATTRDRASSCSSIAPKRPSGRGRDPEKSVPMCSTPTDQMLPEFRQGKAETAPPCPPVVQVRHLHPDEAAKFSHGELNVHLATAREWKLPPQKAQGKISCRARAPFLLSRATQTLLLLCQYP